MFDINKIEIDWAGKKLILETGKIARQARFICNSYIRRNNCYGKCCSSKTWQPRC